MKEKSPAFQFYAADFLADENVQAMSLAERGAYITLMAFCWREGSIPADSNRMARLCGCHADEMAELWQAIAVCFEPSAEPDRLIHPRLELEREKQAKHRKKRSEAGAAGAKSRWGGSDDGNRIADASQTDSNAIDLPMAKNGSSSSFSSSSSSLNKKPIGTRGTRLPPDWKLPEDWKTEAKQIRPEWPDHHINLVADAFRDFWIGKTGKDATKADWLATWRNWCRKDNTPIRGPIQLGAAGQQQGRRHIPDMPIPGRKTGGGNG